jgi:hypothetical protein
MLKKPAVMYNCHKVFHPDNVNEQKQWLFPILIQYAWITTDLPLAFVRVP